MKLTFKDCPDVRISVPEDAVALLELMKQACEEHGEHKINETKIINVLGCAYNKQGVLLSVIGEVGNPVAYCLSILDSVWYSDDMQLVELSLFVEKNHRKSNYAKQLMNFMKQASDGLDLNLTIGVLSNERTAAKVRLYQRQFNQAGAFFTYHPSHS